MAKRKLTQVESGRKAGRARAKALTAARRREIARIAALARWAGTTPEDRKAERARWRKPETA